MIVVRNSIIPFRGYKAMNIFGILFYRKEFSLDSVTINHESIHTAQMRELLYIPFYIWYAVEYFVRLLRYWNHKKAYRQICFEQEAYAHENENDYCVDRKHYSWMKYYK